MNPNTDLLTLLTREGVLINASVRYPRFHKKLKPADLGLSPDQVSERFVSLGHKRLLPREALARLALVESRTHALIDQGSFSFLGGIGRFLPNGKLPETQAKLDELQRDFTGARDEFLARYDHHRSEALAEWRELARQIGGDSDERERLVSQIAEAFPPRGLLEPRFAFEVHLFQIALPEQLSLDLVTFADQAEVTRARQEAAAGARRQIREGVERFLGDCVTTLREETAQLCGEMLASMREGKTEGVHQKTLNRLTRFIDDFRQLNFVGDVEMERQLERVRGELLTRSAEDYRHSPAAVRSLEAGLGQLRDHARNLAGQDARELVERFGQMGRRKLHLAG
jgi:hypothetical protein